MKTPVLLSFVVLVGLASVGAQQGSPGAARAWTPTVTALTSPAGPASAQPQMTVSPRGILLSWVEQTGATATLKFS